MRYKRGIFLDVPSTSWHFIFASLITVTSEETNRATTGFKHSSFVCSVFDDSFSRGRIIGFQI